MGRDSEVPASLCGLSLRPPWAAPLLPSSVTHTGSLNATRQLIQSCSQGGAQRGLRPPPHPHPQGALSGRQQRQLHNAAGAPRDPHPPHLTDSKSIGQARGLSVAVIGCIVTP